MNKDEQMIKLGHRAEDHLERGAAATDKPVQDEMMRTVHELQMHQVELELQNKELRRTQADLERSRDRLCNLYENAPVGYLTLDPDGVIVEGNHEAARLLGTVREHLYGQALHRYLEERGVRVLAQHLKDVLANDSRCHTEVRALDGPLFFRQSGECGSVERDDPARQSAADAQDSEARERAAAARDATGQEQKAAAQDSEAPAGGRLALSPSSLDGEDTEGGARTLKLDSVRVVEEGTGRIRMALFDFTAQRQAEQRLRRAHTELESHVVERTTELRHANHALEREAKRCRAAANALKKADQSKNDFLAMLAHELKNPLVPIRTGLEILKDEKGAQQRAETRALIGRQLDKLSRLVDDLYDLSCISRGKIELERTCVALEKGVVRSALETSRPWIDARNHTLHVELIEPSAHVHVDRFRMAQVVSNLLNNAAKYTPPGGRITVRTECIDGCGVVRVVDDGPGIPPEAQLRLFEPFWQESETESALGEGKKQGLGLGLSLCKGLVELHGGTIEVCSPAAAGRGTEMVVRIPLADETGSCGYVHARRGCAVITPSEPLAEVMKTDRPLTSVSQAPQTTQASQTTQTQATQTTQTTQALDLSRNGVLVVDDNPDTADCLAMLIERLGHDVQATYGGAFALELALRAHPCLMLIDVSMPGIDGLEVARRLRGRKETRDIVLVALTGWKGDEIEVQVKNAGFDAYLAKPACTADIIGILKRYLSDSHETPT
jgi:PAS domain S-box-containing protein